MIRRLFVDNYRSLVNFDWVLGPEMLVLGANGSGKSNALDAIDLIRSWTWGWERLEELLDPQELTRWTRSEVSCFKLDLEVAGETFQYAVEFACGRKRGSEAEVRSEQLTLEDRPVFIRNGAAVTVYNDELDSVASYVLPTKHSAVSSVFASDHPESAASFLAALAQMVVVRPMPVLMETEASLPESRALYRFENFIAWYWSQTQNGKFTQVWPGLLKEVWDDFEYLQLEPSGRKFFLNAVFKTSREDGEFKLEFQELSEGERMIVALYVLLAYQKVHSGTSIIIDEPDNFVALSELQPWLLKMLLDRPDDGQLILVSHNPEIMQIMGSTAVSYFSREEHVAGTRVGGVKPGTSGLSIAEKLKLGWIESEDQEVIAKTS